MDPLQHAALQRAKTALDLASGPPRAPGVLAGRYLKSLAAVENRREASAYAESRGWGTIAKAALGAASTTSAAPLAEVHADFLAAVRARSLLGRLLPRLRKLPAGTPTLRQTAGASAGWVPEGHAIGMTNGVFTKDAPLDPLKVAAIAATTRELARAGIAETLIGEDLIRACAVAVDSTFASTAAAVPGTSPAGILNGATSSAATGALPADLATLLSQYAGNIDSAIIITSTRTAVKLAAANEAVELSLDGESTLCGIPLYFSNAVSVGVLAIVDAARVEVVGYDVAQLDVSGDGTLQMDTSPTNDSATPTATQMVSMFQTDTVALRGTVAVNWRAAPGAVAYLTGV